MVSFPKSGHIFVALVRVDFAINLVCKLSSFSDFFTILYHTYIHVSCSCISYGVFCNSVYIMNMKSHDM